MKERTQEEWEVYCYKLRQKYQEDVMNVERGHIEDDKKIDRLENENDYLKQRLTDLTKMLDLFKALVEKK